MDGKQPCYFKVFGIEEGCGGEDHLLGAVMTVPGITRASWHSESHGLCVAFAGTGQAASVVAKVRALGYQVTSIQASCRAPAARVALADFRSAEQIPK